jgi:hypothetical protein
VSEYGFGAEIEQGEQAPDATVGPKFYREWMDKISGQLGELKAENDRLKAAQQKQEVEKTLTAKGYAPQAAGLYTGTPDKLDDWLSANGAALAKTDGAAVEQGQGVQGTPQTVVSPESQAAQAAFSAAGSGAASGLSGDDQLAARMNAAQNMEELDAILREAGNRMA